jgi:hypothetical protein
LILEKVRCSVMIMAIIKTPWKDKQTLNNNTRDRSIKTLRWHDKWHPLPFDFHSIYIKNIKEIKMFGYKHTNSSLLYIYHFYNCYLKYIYQKHFRLSLHGQLPIKEI